MSTRPRLAARTTAVTAAVTAALLAGSLAGAGSARAVPAGSGCPQVEVTTIRGQWEPANTSGYVLGPMADALKAQLSQTVSIYPLPFNAAQSDVVAATNQAIPVLTNHLASMRTTCPSTKFVVLGFSLGALIAGETFAPTTRYSSITKYALPTSIDPKVAAVVIFGDGRFNAAGPEAAGTFQPGNSANLARPANAFARFGDHVRNVCNQYDGVCQSLPAAQVQEKAHQDYVKYTDALVWYVHTQLQTIP